MRRSIAALVLLFALAGADVAHAHSPQPLSMTVAKRLTHKLAHQVAGDHGVVRCHRKGPRTIDCVTVVSRGTAHGHDGHGHVRPRAQSCRLFSHVRLRGRRARASGEVVCPPAAG